MDRHTNPAKMIAPSQVPMAVPSLSASRRIPVPVNRPSSAVHVSSVSIHSNAATATKQDGLLEKWLQYTAQFTPKNTTLRKHVESAIQKNKIFHVPFGAFPTLRRVMHERGWVELPPLSAARRTLSEIIANLSQPKMPSVTSVEIRRLAVPYPEVEDVWLRRIFKGVKPKFIWHYGLVNWKTISDSQIINRQPKPGYAFTTKVGIAGCLNEMHWYAESGVTSTLFPRCYRLYIDEEKAAFIGDFCLTACIGLLQWIIGMYEKSGKDGIVGQDGYATSKTVFFAFDQIKNYVKARRHKDLDKPALVYPCTFDEDWDEFLDRFNYLVHKKGKLRMEKNGCAEKWYESAKRNLLRIAPYWPQLKIDGTNNLWICKPGARSCGVGITIQNQLEDILNLLAEERRTTKDSNGEVEVVETVKNYWVVQKYIERPLLIYNAKFDIRQWFIVEDWNPLTVWFYKECYLRFCSEPFSMDKLSDSVHLCNFSIQKNYSISEFRDANLPAENVWDNYTFQAYLETLGKMDLWHSLVYPGMKKAILGVLMASQENLFNSRKNSFELYGADFMLSDDMSPWLIEINSVPLMSSATEVYKRMSSQVVEDTVKVIFDRKENPNADTGMFELMYRQAPFRFLPVIAPDVIIRGRVLREEDEKEVSGMLVTSHSYHSLKGSASLSLAIHLHKSKPASLISLRSGVYFMDLMQRIPLKDAKQPDSTLPETHSDYLRLEQDSNFVPSIPSKKVFSSKKTKNKKQSLSRIPKLNQKKHTVGQDKQALNSISNQNSQVAHSEEVTKPVLVSEVLNENANSNIENASKALVKNASGSHHPHSKGVQLHRENTVISTEDPKVKSKENAVAGKVVDPPSDSNCGIKPPNA